MNGSGEEALNIRERPFNSASFSLSGLLTQSMFESQLKTATELGGRLSREGYSCDVLYVVRASGDASRNPSR